VRIVTSPTNKIMVGQKYEVERVIDQQIQIKI